MSGDSGDNKKLTGAEKTAIILLTVGEEQATKIFELMDEEEIKEVSAAMSTLGVLKTDVIENLVLEFSTQISNSLSVVGNIETTEKLLEKFMAKDKVNNIMEEIRGPAGRNTWDKLGNVNEDILAGYLRNEYPQTVALIISKISPQHASRVLAALPPEFSYEVMMRMLSMDSIKKEVLDRVERILKSEFISTLTKTQKANTTDMMAEIFNNFDRSTENKFMTMMEERSPDQAQTIKDLMFTFDDLAKIPGADLQKVMKLVDKQKLTFALKGAGEAVKKVFLDNMSQRAAKILAEDMASMGPVRMKDVDEAQAEIVRVARDLADKGEINLAGDSDQYVY